MGPQDILNDIKNGRISPLYFLQGDEPYYIDLISDYIEENILGEAEKGFNLMVMYGKDVEMNDILANARRFPMMSEKQVVIVKEAQNLEQFKTSEGRTLLEEYVKNPVPSTILVFGYKYGKLDGKTTLAKLLGKYGVVLTSEKLKDYKLPDWIKAYIAAKGRGTTEMAVQLLADHLGNNLERLANEIDKVLINIGAEAVIDEKVIDEYVGISREYNAFELQKAIMLRDVLKANRIVRYFGANINQHHPIPIIALIYNLFSKLAVVHQAKDTSGKELAKQLKINPYWLKDYQTGARNYPLYKVLENIGHIHQADLEIKGVNSPAIGGENILKQLVFKLIH
jgi:DNA polymerase-3 subunit delta